MLKKEGFLNVTFIEECKERLGDGAEKWKKRRFRKNSGLRVKFLSWPDMSPCCYNPAWIQTLQNISGVLEKLVYLEVKGK